MRQRAFHFLFFLSLTLLLSVTGCSTEVDINAPERDIWTVYGVLNPTDSTQDLRISRGFLPEGNAEVAAAAEDFSLKGLLVTLRGDGKEWIATQVDSVQKEEGAFIEYTTVYRFETFGAQALEGGERYVLEITRPDDADFRLRSATTIPAEPEFSRPTNTPGPGGQRCLRQVVLDKEFTVTFNREKAMGFELRAFLDYEEDGVPKLADYGPTPIFTEGVRCSDDQGNEMCYQFRAKELIQAFLQDMDPQPNASYTYGITDQTRCNNVVANLPDDFRFEVTAIDSALTQYILANDPKFIDLNTVRPEFTNIQGEGITTGVFGSVHLAYASSQFDQCTAYLLNLNDTPEPDAPCEL